MGGNDRVIRQKLRHKLLMVSLSLSLSLYANSTFINRGGGGMMTGQQSGFARVTGAYRSMLHDLK